MDAQTALVRLRARDLSGTTGEAIDDLLDTIAQQPHPSLELACAAAAACARLAKTEQIPALLRSVHGDLPGDPHLLADIGLALFAIGERSEAQRLLQHAIQLPNCPAEAFARLGAVEVSFNRTSVAQRAFERALHLSGGWPELQSNLAGTYARQGRYEEAVKLYDSALKARPDLAVTWNMRAAAMRALGRGDELVDELEQQVDADPDDPELHVRLAMAQRQVNDWDGAEATLEAALEFFPGRDDVKHAYIDVMRGRRNNRVLCRRLAEWGEADSALWIQLELVHSQIDAGALSSAETLLGTLEERAAGDPMYLHLQARLRVERGEPHAAVDILRKGIEDFPGFAPFESLLSHTLVSLGRQDEARQYGPSPETATLSSLLRKADMEPEALTDGELLALKRTCDDFRLDPDMRIRALFVSARAFEKKKRYDEAFEAVMAANEAKRKRLAYDWRANRRMVSTIIACTNDEWFNRLRTEPPPRSRPIFVVGMPRSGTTLTEQILGSHPEVFGAGELPWIGRIAHGLPARVKRKVPFPRVLAFIDQDDVRAGRDEYLDRIGELNDDTPCVADKLPHNFMHVGLIEVMFPGSPIIHLKRDPRDVAVSNFFQDYQAFSGTMGFSYSLSDIGHMLNDHDEIMEHWNSRLPGRIFTLIYEDLVSDTENVVRQLLDYCGLEWDDRVLEFTKLDRAVRTASVRQVRQGIYTTSAQKWRRYEAYLGDLDDALSAGYRHPNLDDLPFLMPGSAR